MDSKKVLVISYSQTGQLNNIISNLIYPISTNQQIEIIHKVIKPKKPFPYPWDLISFMDTFPESVYLEGCEIQEIENDSNNYDLVILAYQIWFLSPSLPITAFLKSNYAKAKLNNTPIITVIGCRNMWIMAQEKVKELLKDLNAHLIDNIVFVDQGSSLATFITTPRWLLTGKSDSLWNIFPKAGVSQKDITESSRFGDAIKEALLDKNNELTSPICYGLNAVNVDIKLIKSEEIGLKSFRIWGKLIKKIGPRGCHKRIPAILFYLIFLICLIITIVPINMIIQTIYRKLNKVKFTKLKEKYEKPSGSGRERLKEFM